MDCAVGIDGIGLWSGVCDVDRSGCARKPRGSARAPLGGGCFRPSFRGPRGMGSCGGMREWAHRLWSSSVNSGAMTSQSTSAEHDRNTSGRAAIVLATSARSDARVDIGIKVSFHLQSPLTAGQPRFCEGSRVRVGPRSGPVRRCVGGFTRANRSARVARYPSKRPTVPEAWITARGRLQPAPYQ